jgi:5-oxoprolinase (ATP-hydrolysing)
MHASRKRGWRFAIDRGGTFTDVVAWDPDGRLHVRKVLSQDPRDASDPAVRGIESLLRDESLLGDDATGIGHASRADDAPVAVEWLRVGTTVATNALLERNGARTVLVTTRGHGDALRIGYQQRPDIFARDIRLPPLLHSRVVEADERVDVHGEVLRALDETALERDLSKAHRDGFDSVAISFLHGWLHPRHEQRAAEIARRVGFGEVVTSHQTVAVQGFIARGDTAVAEAYLSPVLVRYISGLRRELERRGIDAPLYFMQSHGGLVEAAAARGVNGVLSGPAGGVIGMVAAAGAGEPRPSQADRRLLGLDMGGTSTDVSLYAQELPRRPLTVVDGVRIQAPMMDVHSIAAGGGSIARFHDGRLQVGPQSAGADPGPACYGRGGPVTLTDCNLVLGRIQPALFPRTFGADAQSALDPQASRDGLAAIRSELGAATAASSGLETVEALAAAFVEIANTSMAHAVRELALRHGEDVAQYALVCFGGAGGQHACALAEQLEIDEILLHPLGGVLSAYGIGLATSSAMMRRTVELPLDPEHAPQLAAMAGDVATASVRMLEQRGIERSRVATTLHAALRLPNSDTALEVDWQDQDAMRASFEASHARHYGFHPNNDSLVVAAFVAEATERSEADVRAADASDTAVTANPRTGREPGKPRATARVWDGRAWATAPVVMRAALHRDVAVEGPALVAEHGATIWVARGWTGRIDAAGVLVLGRNRAHGHFPARGDDSIACDPRRLEVFNGLFMHIAEQMGTVLERTASSVNIKERRDFSCAIFDANASLVANAPHMPVHLGSMGASVAAVIERFGSDLRAGDAYLVNSPYAGGTHLPDLTVVTPVFIGAGATPFAFCASRAHHADIGGMTPGSMPAWSRSIDEEGVLCEPMRIVRGNELDAPAIRATLAAGRWPARDPDRNLEDLQAQLAANARGAAELARARARYGEATVRAYLSHVQDHAEDCMRRVIRSLGSGSYRYELDNGQAIAVRVAIDREGGSALVDFGGTSAQEDNNFNAPRAVTVAAVLYVFRTLIGEPIPLNAGCLRPLTIAIPRGSMLDPTPPGAVVAGNVETSQCIVDALYGALGVLAASQGTMNNFTFGNERYQYYETIAGGAGAGPEHDGASGVQTHMTNTRLTDPEVLEQRFPVLLREFSLRKGSGGNGRHRGGDGLVRTVEFREAMTAAILSNHRRIAPFGLAGGEPAQTGRNIVLRRGRGPELVPGSVQVTVEPGDVVSIETPGGGGYGQRIVGR